jgi:hypothetical protein
MDPLVTFHVLPVPKWDKVEIMVWDRGHGHLGSLDMPTATWDRIRPHIMPGPGFRVRVHRP